MGVIRLLALAAFVAYSRGDLWDVTGHDSARETAADEHHRGDLRIAFGSCNRHDRAQDLWPAVRSLSADAWVWLGDAIYADGKVDNVRRYGGRAFHRDAYATQNEHPEYAALRAETRILGTWDDHDYGFNNAGAEWREKEFAQRLFLDFLGEPLGSPRRTRAGVYEAYTFRGLGASQTGSARLILLDARFHASAKDGTLLGDEQWEWFERLMLGRRTGAEGAEGGAEGAEDYYDGDDEGRPSSEPRGGCVVFDGAEMNENTDCDPVDVTIVGSSVQVHAHTQELLAKMGIGMDIESWNDYPAERRRLFDLVAAANVRTRAVVLSGDVHHSEIGGSPAGCDLPSELVEITSSGMTHGVLEELPFKFLRRLARHAKWGMEYLPPWLFPDVGNLRRRRYVGYNFGEVVVDFGVGWDGGAEGGAEGGVDDDAFDAAVDASPPANRSPASERDFLRDDVSSSSSSSSSSSRVGRAPRAAAREPTVSLRIRGVDGGVKLSKTVPFSALEGEWADYGARGASVSRSRAECRGESSLTAAQTWRLPVMLVGVALAGPAGTSLALWWLWREVGRVRRKRKAD